MPHGVSRPEAKSVNFGVTPLGVVGGGEETLTSNGPVAEGGGGGGAGEGTLGAGVGDPLGGGSAGGAGVGVGAGVVAAGSESPPPQAGSIDAAAAEIERPKKSALRLMLLCQFAVLASSLETDAAAITPPPRLASPW